jgi:hypothetical protein
LIKAGADVRDGDGRTPLYAQLRRGRQPAC